MNGDDTGRFADVRPKAPGYAAPMEPAVTVIVVTWQGAHLLADCLDSLVAQSIPTRILVVDNASTDGTTEVLARYPAIEVLHLAENTGFAGGVQAAIPLVDTPFLALLNNDAAADPEWLERSLAAFDAHPAAAAITARMLLWDATPSRINNAGVALVRGAYGADRGLGAPDSAPYDVAAEVFGFSGGAAVLRTDAVKAVGGMAAEFFLYYEDTDLAWRLRLMGHEVWYEPSAVVRHRHAATTDRSSDLFAFHTERNRLLMLLRCAPISFALAQIVRFAITTASLALKRACRRPVPENRVFSLALRTRVLWAVTVRLVPTLARRRAVSIAPTSSRRAVLNRWLNN